MPRGRPPKDRTKEEALSERREQVRRNVQAFRRRQHVRKHGDESTPEGSKENQFEASDDQTSDHSKETTKDSPLTKNPHSNLIIRILNGKQNDLCLLESQETNNDVSNDDVVQVFESWSVLPPEMNHARISRQQFVYNCAIVFDSAADSSALSVLATEPHWTQTFPGMVNINTVLDLSIQAICLMQLGHVNQERWLVEESRTHYGRALTQMGGILSRNDQFEDELFATAMTLGGYELFQGPNAHGYGWQFHFRAAAKYMEALSEKGCLVPENPHVFNFLETACIFDAIGSRKQSSFMRSGLWLRCLTHFGGDIYGSLLMLMSSLPALLEQHDSLVSMSKNPSAFQAKSELLERCFRFEDDFQIWYHNIEDRLFDPRILTTEPPGSDIVFPNLHIARLLLLYWSSKVLLHEMISSLFNALHDSTLVPGALSTTIMLNDQSQQSHKFAANIKNSVAFCLRPSQGLVGKSVVMLPLWIARSHFEQCNDDEGANWCSNVLKRMGLQHLQFGLGVES